MISKKIRNDSWICSKDNTTLSMSDVAVSITKFSIVNSQNSLQSVFFCFSARDRRLFSALNHIIQFDKISVIY